MTVERRGQVQTWSLHLLLDDELAHGRMTTVEGVIT